MSSIQPIFGSRGNEVCLFADNAHCTENGAIQTGLIFSAQQGQQLMTDAVPLKIERLIARILSEEDLFSHCELSQRELRQIQQRTDQLNVWIAGESIPQFHSGQTFAATAPKQTEKKKFKLIIG